MMKTFKRLSVILSAFFLLTGSLYAGSTWSEALQTSSVTATPTVYGVNPTSMQLCETYVLATGVCAGDVFTFTKTWTGPDGDGYCDIAAMGAGLDVCNYGPTTGMPSGVTYTYIRFTLDRTFKMNGTLDTTTQGNATTTSCSTSSAIAVNGGGFLADADEDDTTPTTQLLFMPSAPGNETSTGNATIGTANTAQQNSVQIEMVGISAQGGSLSSNWQWSYDVPIGGKVWIGDANLNANSDITMIYPLTTPYTTKKGLPPRLVMSIDVTGSLTGGVFQVAGTNESCFINIGSPTTTFAITD